MRSVDSTNALGAMHRLLDRYVSDPRALVFVQSIRQVRRIDGPAATATAWNIVGNDQTRLGGHAYLFNTLAGSVQTYAMVAPGAAGQACRFPCVARDVSVANLAATGTPGRLAGVLSRNTRGQYHAATATSSDVTADSLEQVVYQDPVPWPMRDAEHAPAMGCVTAALEQRLGAKLQTPIEANYYSSGEMIRSRLLATLQNDLAGLDYGSVRDIPGCGGDVNSITFEDVKGQLARELGYVAIVGDLIDGLEATFYDDRTAASRMQTAIDEVASAINSVPAGARSSLDGWAIAADLLSGIALIPEPAFEKGAELVAVAFDLISETEKTDAGDPAIDVTARADALASVLAQKIDGAVARYDAIGGMIVADWGRLSRAAANAVPGQPWALTADAVKRAQSGIDMAGARLAYRGLFGLRYGLYRLNGNHQPPGLNSPADYRCAVYEPEYFENSPFPKPRFMGYWAPFGGYAPQGGGFSVVPAAGSNGLPVNEWWVYGNANSGFITKNNGYSQTPSPPDPTGGRTPPASLMKAMFVTPSSPGAPPVFPSNLRFALDEFSARSLTYVKTVDAKDRGGHTFKTQCVIDNKD